jgi:Auxiliary Activity family 9 (formerly GH61)
VERALKHPHCLLLLMLVILSNGGYAFLSFSILSVANEFRAQWVTHQDVHWTHDTGTHRSFMAACNGDCKNANPNSLNWFELGEEYTGQQNWNAANLWPALVLNNDQTWSDKIPALPAGQYLLRNEVGCTALTRRESVITDGGVDSLRRSTTQRCRPPIPRRMVMLGGQSFTPLALLSRFRARIPRTPPASRSSSPVHIRSMSPAICEFGSSFRVVIFSATDRTQRALLLATPKYFQTPGLFPLRSCPIPNHTRRVITLRRARPLRRIRTRALARRLVPLPLLLHPHLHKDRAFAVRVRDVPLRVGRRRCVVRTKSIADLSIKVVYCPCMWWWWCSIP